MATVTLPGNPDPTARRRRRTWSRKGVFTERFACFFTKRQMQMLIEEASKKNLNIVDIIREGVNIGLGLSPRQQ